MAYHTDDTIAAVATAAGGAARGMVRVSGPAVAAIVARCFRADDRYRIDDTSRATARSGSLEITLDSRSRRIPGDLFFWPTARSYTREPVAEFHTLGSEPLLRAVLDAVCRTGARLAEPGEFTLRAFLSGRIDLTQAEAVLGVIDAQQESQLNAALAQLAGGLAQPLTRLRDELLQLLAELEAGLDFVDEDIEFISVAELMERLSAVAETIRRVVRQMGSRNAEQGAPRVALVGPPNVGKSSLFNTLATRFGIADRRNVSAIVSAERGTTRDYLVTEIDVGGLRCELVDTAGIDDEACGEIAAAAQRFADDRRRQAALQAYCVDAMISAVTPIPYVDLVIVTKIDLVPHGDESFAAWNDPPTVVTSSVTGEGLDSLRQVLARLLTADTAAAHVGCIGTTAARCRDGLRLAQAAVARAREVAAGRGGDELVAAEVRTALAEIGKVVGAVYTDDLLDRIFKSFCIGK
jgi:tRNA modification GTPase